MSLLERLGIELPVVQAGMGGGIARHELAAAVGAAGGLGTVGFMPVRQMADELAAVRERTAAPVAANLLLPFTTGAHREVAEAADVVVTFWGDPQRRTERTWLHQVGSIEEARAAQAAGADGVIVQGVEAGGHVRGTTPALTLLEQARGALPDGYPLWLAGGIADARDVSEALAAGAEATVLGTRFLLSDESRAHPGYKAALLAADRTIHTDLFGLGWPAAHRVVANAATDRWLRRGRTPGPLRLLHRALPAAVLVRAPAVLQASYPPLSPAPPVDDGPERLVGHGPLYAGETVARIREVLPAAAIVAGLRPAPPAAP